MGFGTTLVLLLLFAPVLLATVGSDVVVSTPAHPMMPFDVHSLVAGEADDKATLSSPAGEAQWVLLSWFEHIVQIFFCYPLISKKIVRISKNVNVRDHYGHGAKGTRTYEYL